MTAMAAQFARFGCDVSVLKADVYRMNCLLSLFLHNRPRLNGKTSGSARHRAGTIR